LGQDLANKAQKLQIPIFARISQAKNPTNHQNLGPGGSKRRKISELKRD
jgi:hypothetical protein